MTPASRSRGRNGPGEVGVAVAAVAGQLGVVADVLGQQDPLDMAAREQLAQQLDDAALAVALERRERHAQEVELDVRAALDDREVVVEMRVRIGVADDDPRPGRPLLSKIQLGETDGRQDGVGRDRRARSGREARAAARWTRSSRARQPRLVRADLADDPGPDAGLPDPVGRLADELVGEVVDGPPVDERLRGVVARSRYQPQPITMWSPVGARQPRQPARVATDPGRRQVDERAATGRRGTPRAPRGSAARPA